MISLNEGMLYENAIAQMITAKERKMYFYTRYSEEKHRNDIEIDFLLSNESKLKFRVFPLEVKFIHPKNFAVDREVIKIPPYMFWTVF